ncbi:MAG: 30S ribosomal protein S20 [Bacilli bacterium]|nr:30S ribosomal protein S20 [Bacilli bacterium]
MANIKSQVKRIKTNEKANERNVAAKSALRTANKKVLAAVDAKDLDAANKALANAVSLIDKSVSDGVQKANTAARQKAKLQKLVNKISK